MSVEAPAKEPCYLRSERSPVFARFCERVYGTMLNQYGTADLEQLDLLVQTLQLGPESLVLDAGCGTGFTTRYLCERTGARFVGFDNMEAAIVRARRLAEPMSDRLSFVLGDLNALDFEAASFDAVIAIESLYFPRDLAATIGQFKALLRPRGRMGLFFTHFGEAPLSPAQSKLGQALAANGLAFDAHDLTAQDRKFWRRAKEVGEELRNEAAHEGNADLLHLGETDAVLGMIDKGGHGRHLYLVPSAG